MTPKLLELRLRNCPDNFGPGPPPTYRHLCRFFGVGG
jgi:hypothetical protein